jgi:3-deoxy-D-manno-octulosonic-acid transferase
VNALVRIPYDLAWRAIDAIAPLVPKSDSKISRAIKSREGLLRRIDTWAGANRDPTRQLLWMHAASVGESLQALPVLSLFRERNPSLQIVFTFFSPSAEAAAQKFPADLATYLPFDTAASMRHAIRTLRPSLIVFSKLDVWPTLVREAVAADVKTAVISATLHADSGRRSMLASLLLRDAYAALDSVGAISAEDRTNIIELGAKADRVAITGDTRFDQVWARKERGGPTELLDHLRSNRPTIVAGSTWESDEKHLLAAFLELRPEHKRARIIIAPHEPNATHAAALSSWARSSSLTFARIDEPHAAAADVILVDRVGVLGDLYVLADIAYVGGGFHRAGLHSVLEPAAFGKPVLFGAPFGRSRDAELMVAASAARSVCDTEELKAALSGWLTDSNARVLAGAAALDFVKKGLGAAEASYELVSRLLATGA